MNWNVYLVVFDLLSPLHIGKRKVGNLQQTRPYLISRNMWGAITARLVREIKVNAKQSDYNEIGKKVDSKLRFSYFYPLQLSTHKEFSGQFQDQFFRHMYWPWGKYQDYFSWLFIDSYASTALAENQTAKDGSLHETEYILPVSRENKKVYLVGYIFEKNDCDQEVMHWKNVLNKLQFGGERAYGWGRVKVKNIIKLNTGHCFGYPMDLNDFEGPLIELKPGECLLAHALAGDINCNGEIEPLMGRVTRNASAYGGNLSRAEICWVPGSKVNQKYKFAIISKGIWSLHNRLLP